MGKPNIALVTGGYSGESVISYKSAVTIRNNISADLFNVFYIDINPQSWDYVDDNGKKFPVNRSDFSVDVNGKVTRFDAVFIGIHGTPGEDGKLQGYFDLLQIPYTSCDAATSALTFNKRYTVAVASFAGINVARSLHLFSDHPLSSKEVLSQLSLPVFVKPNNGGSSIGMSKVSKSEDLDAAIAKAFKEDNQVLIEEYISGREFTVGVFKSKGEIIVLPITEVTTEKDFFDYEAKYEGKSKEITPAVINEQMADTIRDTARKVYAVFNCNGVVRIDFIYNEAKQAPYMLEINTVPGQSEASIIPQQVRAMGWQLKDFYGALIQQALSSK